MPERSALSDDKKRDGAQAHVRPTAQVHVSIELLSEPLQKSLLAKGVTLEKFDPTRPCFFRSFIPPRGNPVADYFTKFAGGQVGISCVQQRKVNEGKSQDGGFKYDGKLQSCTVVNLITEWMRVRRAPEVFIRRSGVSYENGERLFARIKPPTHREGVLESVIEFHTGARCTISDIAGEVGEDDQKARGLYLDPMDEDDQTYFDAIMAGPQGVIEQVSLLYPVEKSASDLMQVRQLFNPDNIQPRARPGVPQQRAKALPAPEERPERGNLVHLPTAR